MFKLVQYFLCFMCAGFLSVSALIAAPLPDIQLQGVFKDQAIVVINGQQRLLKSGSSSPEGVLLLDVQKKQVTIEWQGQTYDLDMNRHISSAFSVAERKSLAIPRDRSGSYRTRGYINGKSMEMLIDTGATSVAMSSNQADSLGIPYLEKGTKSTVRTASGVAEAYGITLNKVRVGDIERHQIRAVVILGAYPATVLLGMTFLDHVDLRETGGILYLDQI
jgi:aspartyl protease family protein